MNKVYVGNLPYQVTEEELQSTFEGCGDIDTIRIIKDRDTGRSKGFAFVSFVTADSAQNALSLDGNDLSGRNIKVNIARERTEGGHGGMGGRR